MNQAVVLSPNGYYVLAKCKENNTNLRRIPFSIFFYLLLFSILILFLEKLAVVGAAEFHSLKKHLNFEDEPLCTVHSSVFSELKAFHPVNVTKHVPVLLDALVDVSDKTAKTESDLQSESSKLPFIHFFFFENND